MIYLIEGVDGSGKTTLARELSDRLNVPIFKSTNRPVEMRDDQIGQDAAMIEDLARIDLLQALGGPDVIIDRSFPSSYVYGKMFSRRIEHNEIMRQDEQLAKLPHMALLCLRGLVSSFPRNGLEDEQIVEMEKLYEDFRNMSRLDWRVLRPEMNLERRIETVMLLVASSRPNLSQTYMAMAKQVARRSTCLSRRNGAVLVTDDGHVIATGYNGPPKGMGHPVQCPRLKQRVASGSGLELCDDVHAEENCIVQAAKLGISVVGSTLYTVMSPCHRCYRMLANAEVAEVVYEREYGDVRALSMDVPGIRVRKAGE